MTNPVTVARTISGIPVRNLWLLMLYASQLYREIPGNRRRAVEENPDDIPNLVAEILTRAVHHRLKRSLSFNFRHKQANLTRVRGRIDVLITERRQLLQRGEIFCSFDELTVDTPRNQFVKAALNELMRTVKDKNLTRRCRTAVTALERAGVRNDLSESRYRRATGTQLTTARMNAEDRQMLAAARLAFNLDLPSEEEGRYHLPEPERDPGWARRLFEAAVGGFYDVTLSPRGWRVQTGRKIDWQIERPTRGIDSILPSMKTDIVLERPPIPNEGNHYRTIIDTKFTHILSSSRFRELSLRSGYIYQIYAYLRSQERDDDPPSLNAAGMLLHPTVSGEVDEAVTIQGHRVRFVTVNLAGDSNDIRNRLLALADADYP